MNKIFVLVFALAVLARLTSDANAQAQMETYTNEDIVRNFEIVALRSEYEKRKEKTVLKWNEPWRIAIIGKNYPPFFEEMIREHLADLSWETRHPMKIHYSETMRQQKRLAKDVSKVKINIVLFYGPKRTLADTIFKRTGGAFPKKDIQYLIDNSICSVKLKHRKGAIHFAYAAFPAEHNRHALRACIIEELTQIMGLINDSRFVERSIFNDHSRYLELTLHDRWLLRVLYNSEMKPGMPADQALKEARRYLSVIRPE